MLLVAASAAARTRAASLHPVRVKPVLTVRVWQGDADSEWQLASSSAATDTAAPSDNATPSPQPSKRNTLASFNTHTSTCAAGDALPAQDQPKQASRDVGLSGTSNSSSAVEAGANGAQTNSSGPDSISQHKASQPSTDSAAAVPSSSGTPQYRLQGVAACLEQLKAFSDLCGPNNQQKLREFLNSIFDYQEVIYHSKPSTTSVVLQVSNCCMVPCIMLRPAYPLLSHHHDAHRH